MMLKSGYRHVYVSRSFALNHGFIPKDTTPGNLRFQRHHQPRQVARSGRLQGGAVYRHAG